MRVEIEGQGLERFSRAVSALSDKQAQTAYRRAINRVGKQAQTATIRALAPQVGLTQAAVRKHGGIKPKPARSGNLQYEINSQGGYLPLHLFAARQFGYGVRAKPWGTSRRFAGAFIFAGSPNSGKFVGGGAVFRRLTTASRPIEMMFGPAVPKEMVTGNSAEAFINAAGALPDRIAHEVRAITKGVVTG